MATTATDATGGDVTQRKPPAPDSTEVPPVAEKAPAPAGASRLEAVKGFVVTKLIPFIFFLQEKASKLYTILVRNLLYCTVSSRLDTSVW